MNTLGDPAENVFDTVAPFGKHAEFGWRRPPVTMRHMTDALRHMPDFYVESGFLVEVMGCGRDDIVKLKPPKWEGLKVWNAIQPVALFVYNSARSEWCVVAWKELKSAVNRARRAGTKAFSDGNEYWEIPWDSLVDDSLFHGPVEDVA